MFLCGRKEAFLFISTHVDALFVLYNTGGRAIRDKVNRTIKQTMEMTEKGEISFALDMKIERDTENGRLKISQKAYIESILRDFGELAPGVKDTPAPVDDIKDEGTHTREEEAEINSKPIRNIIGKLWWIDQIYTVLYINVLFGKPNKKLWTHFYT